MVQDGSSTSTAAFSLRIPPRATVPRILFARVGVDLKDAERVAFGIDEVALPASAGHSEFRQSHDASHLLYFLRNGVEALHFKRAYESIGTGLRRRARGRRRAQGAPAPPRVARPLPVRQ